MRGTQLEHLFEYRQQSFMIQIFLGNFEEKKFPRKIQNLPLVAIFMYRIVQASPNQSSQPQRAQRALIN